LLLPAPFETALAGEIGGAGMAADVAANAGWLDKGNSPQYAYKML
jgi:hypothetical protein